MIRTVAALMRKEFYQIFRDPVMLRLIFLIPIIQLLLLSYAADIDVKQIYTAIYDYDQSELSREYVRSFSVGDYFLPRTSDASLANSDLGFRENRDNTVMIIPVDFSEKLQRSEPVQVGLVVDGANANSASTAMGYAAVITAQFNRGLSRLDPPVSLRQAILYNPQFESLYFMVPGILAILLTMITVMLTSMAIVREREVGTLEQLMVTPIPVPGLILGKTLPFAVLGYIELSIALAFGVIWFRIPFVGSWPLLYALSFLFLLTTLGVGMFISTLSTTQQQAMFFAWFFSIFAIMTSGFFIPIDNMPPFVQHLTYLNPVRYYMTIIRGIMMKGAGAAELHREVIAMVIFGIGVFGFAWMRFAKRVK